jgi:lipoyl-dependent peroxiredoxin
MKIKRRGSADRRGGPKDGSGAIMTESGALNAYPYSFSSRFEGQRGGNPEELIGAAHASPITMALADILGEARVVAGQMESSADVTLEEIGGAFAITSVHLVLKARIPSAEESSFDRLVAVAKGGYPAWKLLKVKISLDLARTD